MVKSQGSNFEQRSHRPGCVTLLTLGVLMLTVIHLIRLSQAIIGWSFLAGLLPYLPFYFTFSGLVWGVSWSVIALGLWQGRHWAPNATRLVSILFTLYQWGNRWLVENPQSRNANSFYWLVVNLVFLLFVFWVLSRRTVRIYFGGKL